MGARDDNDDTDNNDDAIPEEEKDPEGDEGDDAGGEDAVKVSPVHRLPGLLIRKIIEKNNGPLSIWAEGK